MPVKTRSQCRQAKNEIQTKSSKHHSSNVLENDDIDYKPKHFNFNRNYNNNQVRRSRRLREKSNPNPKNISHDNDNHKNHCYETKRKLSDNTMEKATPPKKCQKISYDHLSPSKLLSTELNKLKLKNDIESDEKSREKLIQSMQELLMTEDINYELKGRDNEYEEIYNFIVNQLRLKQGNSFYICGSPGTGKTAIMINIYNELSSIEHRKYYNIEHISILNGMRLAQPTQIYSSIYRSIFNSRKNITPYEAKVRLENYFVLKSNEKNKKMCIIVIDEIDGLLGKNQTILYHLFSWTKRENSKLILIGIANSIDLTERFLPKLKVRKISPSYLLFEPYSTDDLFEIIKYRLNYKSHLLFDDIALKFCCKKIARNNGDLRACLAICRNSLDILLYNKKINKIGFAQMQEIINQSFGSPLIDTLKALPQHQKCVIVIASILCKNRSKHNKTDNNHNHNHNHKNDKHKIVDVVSIQTLFSFYSFMAKKYGLPKTSTDQFYAIMDALIGDRMMCIPKTINKTSHLLPNTKLQILVAFDDVLLAAKDDTILAKLFQKNVVIHNKFLQ